jgi:small subunit ribosomal protein S6
MMRNYELMLVLRSDLGGEEATTAQIDRIQGFVRDNGGTVTNVEQTQPWGRRRLAFEIDDQQEGYYVLAHFDLSPDRCDELERNLKLTDSVLRYLLVRADE